MVHPFDHNAVKHVVDICSFGSGLSRLGPFIMVNRVVSNPGFDQGWDSVQDHSTESATGNVWIRQIRDLPNRYLCRRRYRFCRFRDPPRFQ